MGEQECARRKFPDGPAGDYCCVRLLLRRLLLYRLGDVARSGFGERERVIEGGGKTKKDASKKKVLTRPTQ